MAFSSNPSAQTSEINVTPLIDVLLVLLIIFMVVLPGASQGLDTSVQEGKPEQSRTLSPVVIRLVAAPSGTQIDVSGNTLSPADVPAALRNLFKLRQDRTLFVQADRSLTYQEVAAVVGEGRDAGAGAIVLSGLPK